RGQPTERRCATSTDRRPGRAKRRWVADGRHAVPAFGRSSVTGCPANRHAGRRTARAQRDELTSVTAQAVMLTLRRIVAEGVWMCTGRAAPSSTGPMVTLLPAVDLSRLYAMLAASMLGSTSRLASPSRVLTGKKRLR